LTPTQDFCVRDHQHCTPYQPKPALPLLRRSPAAATPILQVLLLLIAVVAGWVRQRQESGGAVGAKLPAAAAKVIN